MLIILFLLTTWIGKFSVNMQVCPSPISMPCSPLNQTYRVINVNGVAPGTPPVSCMMIQNDNSTIVYDPIVINTVWITLTNSDNSCQASNAKALSVATQYNLNTAALEVIILNITPQYLRIVIVPKGCVSCNVTQYVQNFDTNPIGTYPALYPAYYDLNQLGQYCLNGGTLNPNYNGAGYNCICPAGVSLNYGPSCEYMEATIYKRQTYLSVFRSETTINIRFSLFSNGIIGTISLLSIKNANYQKIVEVIIQESIVVLKTENVNTANIPIPVDNQNWFDFTIVVNRQNATLSVNASSITLNLLTTATANFNAFYLILNENSISSNKIGMQKLIINSRVIDLNSPGYVSCCINRCSVCPFPQICNCRPFESFAFTSCYCPPGTTISGTTCAPNNIATSQISNTVASTLLSIGNTVPISRLDFGFQTYSSNGTLLTLNLQTPLSPVYVQILNSNLTLNITGQRLQTLNYNVSNGIQHNVTLTLSIYSIVMILDNNLNYSISVLNWFTNSLTSPITQITATSLSMGPLLQPYVSAYASPNNTLSTCFSSVQLNTETSPLPLNPATASNLLGQCSTGPRCNTINCSNGTICNDTLWQNTQCIPICPIGYTYVNLSCLPTVCISNPCVNGQCNISSAGSYACNCTGGYTGNNCSIPPTALATLWYIAVIVVLFLLLVIIIALLVYFCCFAAAKNPVNDGYITKINENVVIYNDQAGESDYTGPPINFARLNNALSGVVDNIDKAKSKDELQLPPDFASKKHEFDRNNKDLILDHPLEYGFEGFESDDFSMSSIGTRSRGSEINFEDLENMEIYND